MTPSKDIPAGHSLPTHPHSCPRGPAESPPYSAAAPGSRRSPWCCGTWSLPGSRACPAHTRPHLAHRGRSQWLASCRALPVQPYHELDGYKGSVYQGNRGSPIAACPHPITIMTFPYELCSSMVPCTVPSTLRSIYLFNAYSHPKKWGCNKPHFTQEDPEHRHGSTAGARTQGGLYSSPLSPASLGR